MWMANSSNRSERETYSYILISIRKEKSTEKNTEGALSLKEGVACSAPSGGCLPFQLPTLLSWRHKEAGLRQRCRTTGGQNSGGACFALKTTVARHRSRQLEMGRVQVGAARSEEQRRS